MDLRESLRVFRQHWFLTSVLLLLTVAVSSLFAITLPVSYSASSTVALLNSPASSQTIGGGNPYLSFDASLVETANLIVIQLGSQENMSSLQSQGDTASFEATVLAQNPETEEPFIQIEVSGKNKGMVTRTLQAVTFEVNILLDQLQTNQSAKNKATVQVVAQDSQPSRDASSKIKPLVGFIGVGLVLTFIIPQAAEGVAARRRVKRAKKRAKKQSLTEPKPTTTTATSTASGTESELKTSAPEFDASVKRYAPVSSDTSVEP
jgi:hypothetical protein